MRRIVGKYNTAVVFTGVIEEKALEQIKTLCDQEFVKGSTIRIMPDVHAGIGCTIGFTMVVTDKVCPNLVGVDIGCGMRVIKLGNVDIDYHLLDKIIRKNIPSGFNVHKNEICKFDKITELKCYKNLTDISRHHRSVGTLGGGNHFIEIDVDAKENKYLVVHTGSRNLGHQVASYYQKLAVELCSGAKNSKEINDIIKTYKEQLGKKEIQSAIKQIRATYSDLSASIPKDLCFLTGIFKNHYLHDMKICQEFAVKNREMIADIILNSLNLIKLEEFESVHNYIDFKTNILRKGAVSALKGEKLIIPINMRDGCIIGIGKGNPDWNYSAPHGAGRLMSRTEAKERITLDEFKDSMKDIFTTSVNKKTIDESPMAYKSIEDIVNNIHDTVDIIEIIKPVYNFKASD